MKQNNPQSIDSSNMNQDQVNQLLNNVGSQVGSNASQLKQQIQEGKVDELIKKLPPDKAKTLNEVLNDPEKAKKMLQSPQAKMLMKLLLNTKNPTDPNKT